MTSTLCRAVLFLLLFCLAAPVPPVQAAKLMVFAASSLTEVFTELRQQFQARYPQHQIALHFAGSQVLRTQIEQGAPADLFASADRRIMDVLVQNGQVEIPQVMAHNRLAAIAPADLTSPISTLSDLAAPGRFLVIGTAEVPVGRYTRSLFQCLERHPDYGPGVVSGLARNIVSEETNAKAIATKVAMAEIDGGIVYQTDLTPALAARCIAIELPQECNPMGTYLMGTVAESPRKVSAEDFQRFALSPAGQAVFEKHGFFTVKGH